MKKSHLRSLISICLILAVFVVPLLTESRYRAYLNSFAAAIAKEYYFSSNYLKQENTMYTLNGWNGLSVEMDEIQIRNYDNTLLTNQTGQDLDYKLDWTVQTFGEDEQALPAESQCSLVVEYKGGTTSEGEEARTPIIQSEDGGVRGSITCKILGDGNSKKDNYRLYLVAPADGQGKSLLENGSYVDVMLTATNRDARNQYSRTITATIRYYVSMLEDFIRQFDLQDEGDTLVTNIATNTIPGTGNVQKVYMWWDTDLLAVNRFNYQFNQLFLAGNYEEVSSADGTRTFGLLEISASSLSSRTFQFKKLQDGLSFANNAHVLAGASYTEAGATDYIGYYLEDINNDNATEEAE